MSANLESALELSDLDRDGLVELILEKNKRILDLERLFEDQKRLREQDSSQVERKANQIKEWVTKKLKELENQNKQLRDENKKQKEVVESLSSKLATMSPISSPRSHVVTPLSSVPDQVLYIDQNIPSSPIDTIDLEQSLRTRRPQLKHKLKLQQQHLGKFNNDNNSIHICSETERGQDKLYIKLDNPVSINNRAISSNDRDNISIKSANTISRNIGVSLVSIGQTQSFNSLRMPTSRRTQHQHLAGRESPLYDTVNIDLNHRNNKIGIAQETSHYDQSNTGHSNEDESPPPLPLHQSDRWERQLYDLAERTFTSLTSELEASCNALSERQQDRYLDCTNAQRIKSFAKPSFTTIDGDEVLDDGDPDLKLDESTNNVSKFHLDDRSKYVLNDESKNENTTASLRSNSGDSSTMIRRRSDETSQLEQQKNLFSPMRFRSGTKDSILRTQSVKKNPTPEKLYQFISSDLVTRGYLLKHGALRSHHRWYLLKNFHLYSFKRESDELDNLSPSMTLKLDPQFTIQILGQNNDGFPFKLNYHDKQSLTLIAETAQLRDEWCKILTVAINLSNIEPEGLTKQNSVHEGMLTVTKQGHSKKCHAILVNSLVFFLKSPTDPTPMSYIPIKDSRIREITDNHDYDMVMDSINGPDGSSKTGQLQDCSLAIYPRYSLNLDPIYITLANQQETDGWFYQLSLASGLDQSSGTKFERVLTQMMLNTTIRKCQTSSTEMSDASSDSGAGGCMWKDNSVMLYSDKPISQPLTSLSNETLKIEALELFKSIQLFTQVHIEPIAIDYHICLLQNCFKRLLKYPELKNEFYAQLIKQSTYIRHRCSGSKISSSSSSTSGCSSINNQRASMNSISPSSSDCQLITDTQLLEAISSDRELRYETRSIASQSQTTRNNESQPAAELSSSTKQEDISPPSGSELLQVMQIVALAVSLTVPRGRIRWWLIHHLCKFANTESDIGKYALFALKAIDRTLANGGRDNIPSRTEIMSILLRNPHNHSAPHSLPVNFEDGSYLIVGTDGSTTVEEFMITMNGSVNIRPSQFSDFYLFADDPNDNNNTLHILEPQRKILDVVSWWEQAYRQQNSGRYQNTRVIKIYCKKRLVLRCEDDESDQERLLIVHQLNREIVSNKIPISEALILELAAIMTQLTFGDFTKSNNDSRTVKCVLDKISASFVPRSNNELANLVLNRWKSLSGRTALDCVRVYLNCVRKLKL